MYSPTEGDFDVKYSVLHAFCLTNANVIDEKTFTTRNFSQNDTTRLSDLPEVEFDDIEEDYNRLTTKSGKWILYIEK